MKKKMFFIVVTIFIINLTGGYYNCHEFGLEKCDETGESQCMCFCSSHVPMVSVKKFVFLDLNISNHNITETNDNLYKNLFLKSIEHPPRIILS
jgi:hypothetical protein